MQVVGLEIYVNEGVRIGWCEGRVRGRRTLQGRGFESQRREERLSK